MHPRPAFLSVAVLVCLAAASPAQGVATTVTAVQASVSGGAGGQPPQTRAWQPGILLPTSNIAVFSVDPLGVASSQLGAEVTNTLAEGSVRLVQNVRCFDLATGSATSDILVEVSTRQPVRSFVEIEWTAASLTPGAPLPTVYVDIDNNGTQDIPGRPNALVRVPSTIAGTRVFRLHATSSLATTTGQQALATSIIELRVVPDHPEVTITPITAPCGFGLAARETFVPGIQVGGEANPAFPYGGTFLLVVGFAPVFAQLPLSRDCLLLPAPDLVVPFPTAPAPPLQFPTALIGPQRFYVQSVRFDTGVGDVSASDGVLVQL